MAKNYKKKRYSKYGKGKVPKAVKKYVKRTIANRLEDKYLTVVNAGQDVYCNSGGANGYLGGHLTSIGQGTDFNQRTGDKVRLKKLVFNYVLGPDSSLSGVAHIRVLLVQTICKYGEADFDLEMFTGVAPSTASTNDAISDLNPSYRRKYRVFYDKSFTVGSLNQVAQVGMSVGKIAIFSEHTLPVKSLEFSGTTTTSGSSGDIWYYIMTDKGMSAANDGINFRCKAQLYYEDA